MAGPMMIDLGKRAGKRALHAAESALSWQGWNSANPLHPKGPDGRWVKGHPFTRIIGDAPDHIHHLSDEDLASVDQSAESLLRAITAEKGRRGIGRIAAERSAADIPASRTYGTRPKEDFSVAGGSEEALATAYSRTPRINELTEKIREAEADLAAAPVGSQARARALKKLKDLKDERGRLGSVAMGMGVPNPAKPLRAARKPKTDIESVRANWEAAVNGPMPSDRERFRAELSGLTIKQLEELNGEKLPAGAKAQKINHMIEHRLGFRLNSEAIRSTPLSRAETPEQIRIRQEMHAADLAGDRETYRRLHLERLNLRDEEPPVARDEGLSRRFQLEMRRDELQASLREQYGTNANGWPYDSRREELDRIWDELEAMQGGKRVQAPAFDVTDTGHRQARISELTAKINAEPDAGKRATLRKERAALATWKEPGSRSRPREPFRYEGESVEATKERHAVTQAAAGPAFERDQERAKDTAERVRSLLRQYHGDSGLKDAYVLEIVRNAKLNPRQMRLLADEFAVEFRPNNAFEKPLRTKAAREAYFASAVAGAHRRNPLGRTSVR